MQPRHRDEVAGHFASALAAELLEEVSKGVKAFSTAASNQLAKQALAGTSRVYLTLEKESTYLTECSAEAESN